MSSETPSEPEARPVDRRVFLRRAGLVGASIPFAGGIVAAACSSDSKNGANKTAARIITGDQMASAPVADQDLTPEQMDAAHKKGIEDFLANQKTPLTKGKGNVPLQPTMDGDVKVFNVTMDEVDWETMPGKTEKARGYNKMIPGPVLRATEGDKVRVVVKNNLKESSSIHFHGLLVPNKMDGVPFVTQDPITPGATFTYEFTLKNSGTHMYHSHHNSMDQVNRGLLGAFIIDPKDPASYPKYDKEYIMVLNDTLLGYTLNGKGFPATDALAAKKGEKVLVRWLNEGLMSHPMHLHGMPMKVIARDGYMLPDPYLCDTIDVPPGNRIDTLIDANEPGLWAFHCHILSHAEGPGGMFGLVTVLVVQE